MNWNNEIVMISGGSKGIGYAIAEQLGKNGAKISICARDNHALEKAKETLANNGADVLTVTADITQEGDVDRWFSETESTFGNPTILCNNAGTSGFSPFLDITEEAWNHTLAVNCRGVFLCTKRALPNMIAAKQGRIIMTSSIASKYFRRDHSLYFTSKWALNGFSHSLAKEVHEHNIHVNLLCPGMTETNFFETMGGRPHAKENRYADPKTYGEIVEYICTLPDELDTLEICVLPNWQLKNFGIRR